MVGDHINDSVGGPSSRTQDAAPGVAELLRPARPGAYGLHVPTLRDAGPLMIEAPKHWIEWQIVLANGSGTPEEFIDDSRARIRSAPSGWVDLDRASCTSTIHLPSIPKSTEVAQPFLGSTGVVVAHWMGLQSFHAGAFVAHGRAWAILGSKGAGKSSMLAALSLRGLPILTDDLLVVDEKLAGLAGPRCIDLRYETACALGVGDALGVVGTRERWRMILGPVDPAVPLGGWIYMDWGAPDIQRVRARERVETLFANLALRAESHDPVVLSRLMELFALPMLQVRRQREIGRIDRTAEELYAHLEEISA